MPGPRPAHTGGRQGGKDARDSRGVGQTDSQRVAKGRGAVPRDRVAPCSCQQNSSWSCGSRPAARHSTASGTEGRGETRRRRSGGRLAALSRPIACACTRPERRGASPPRVHPHQSANPVPFVLQQLYRPLIPRLNPPSYHRGDWLLGRGAILLSTNQPKKKGS